MSHLPANADLVVETAKVEDYLLNLSHPYGGPKAKYFLGLGFSLEDVAGFAAALKEHGRTRPIVRETQSTFGMKYQIECQLTAPSGSSRCIRAVWIREENDQYRLVTAHPIADENGSSATQ